MLERVMHLVLFYPLLLFSLSFHEAAHAWSADKLGDPTARMLGRITLNPLPHMDFIGTFLFPVIAILSGVPLIGWGKPVPVSVRNLKRDRRDFLWIAAAGPASNFCLAILFSLLLRGVLAVMPHAEVLNIENVSWTHDLFSVLFNVAYMGVLLNVALAIFNLLPIFPLDGGNILRGLLPARLVPQFDQIMHYGMFVILGLFFLGFLRYLFIPIDAISALLLP